MARKSKDGPDLLKVPARRKTKIWELPSESPRRDRAYKREGSRFWQVGFWVGERYIRRTTGALTLRGAIESIPSFRAQVVKDLAKADQPVEASDCSGGNMDGARRPGERDTHGSLADTPLEQELPFS